MSSLTIVWLALSICAAHALPHPVSDWHAGTRWEAGYQECAKFVPAEKKWEASMEAQEAATQIARDQKRIHDAEAAMREHP